VNVESDNVEVNEYWARDYDGTGALPEACPLCGGTTSIRGNEAVVCAAPCHGVAVFRMMTAPQRDGNLP